MLHELDCAIIALRQELGHVAGDETGDEHPAVHRLVNHYHNLLRRWSEL